jgi:hypothetical protein
VSCKERYIIVDRSDRPSSPGDYTKKPDADKLASPWVEIQIDLLASIIRPLLLLDGQANAVLFLDIQITEKVYKDSMGKIHKHKPPKISIEQRIGIIRGDGIAFEDIPDGQFLKL